MKIYKYILDSDLYHSLSFCEDKDIDCVYNLGGSLQGNRWKDLKVKLYKQKKAGDFLQLTPGCPVITMRGWKLLESSLSTYVEPLRLYDNNNEYILMNVLNSFDCLDAETSDINYFPNSKKIMYVEKYRFISGCLKDCFLFKISPLGHLRVFYTQSFQDLIDKYELKGLATTLLADNG